MMGEAPDDNETSSHDDQDKFEERNEKFLSKISTMMYTFGDAKKPLEQSVELMYIILCEQMTLLLIEAEEVADLRGSKEISHRELLFIMRKNRAKLRQLLQYLEILDKIKLNEDGLLLNMCMEFLESIEDCKEFTSLLDDETLTLPLYAKRRLERRLSMIECMKLNEYQEFSKELEVSFCQGTDEFKSWLLQDQPIKYNLTPLAVIIIGFLARETVAEVVDKVLLIKSNKLKGIPCYDYSSNPVIITDASINNTKTKLMKPREMFNDKEHLANISEKEVHIFCKNLDNKATGNGQNNFSSSDAVDTANVYSYVSLPETSVDNFNSSTNESSMDVMDIVNNESSTCKSSITNTSENSENSDNEYVCISNAEDNAEDLIDSSPNGFASHYEEKSNESSFNISNFITSSNVQEKLTTSKTKTMPTLYYPEIEDVSEGSEDNTISAITTENPDKFDTSSQNNCLEVSNKEFLNRKAITPEEIKEAFVQLHKPPILAYSFSSFPVRLKKKFCLAGSFEDL